jgi:alkylhydroperoxidase family enzyme
MLGAVRTRNSLPASLREIAICRPALINKAWFEWTNHAPLLRESEGFTEAKMEVVKQLHPTSQGDLTDVEWAVLRYADKMTRDVEVDDDTFEALKKVGLTNQEIVEVTVTVASYNMVSRFLVALNVGEQNDKKPE